MKRIYSLILCCLTMLSLIPLSSCSKKAEEYTLRLGITVSTEDSSAGKAKSEVTAVALLTDKDGNIKDCVVDCMECEMSVKNGVCDMGQSYSSKNELADSYNMREASSIGKEWYEQAEYFARHVTKMNIENAQIKLDNMGKAEENDLLSGCTMSLTNIKEAFLKAAKDEAPAIMDKSGNITLSLSLTTEDTSSYDASQKGDGLCALYTTVCATAQADNKICATVIDSAEPKIFFSAEGDITKSEFKGTKRELGAAYGMKSASGIQKEWDEQTAFFAEYVKGMSAEEIDAIPTTPVGKGEEPDLLSGCTINIELYKKALAKSLKGK